MKKILKRLKRSVVFTVCLNLIFISTPSFAKSSKSKKRPVRKKEKQLNIRELALPSEVENIAKSAGAIYYNPSVKGKVLIPVHFWGEVRRSGLHFVPTETSLVKALSMAGGPNSNGVLENIRVTTHDESEGKSKNHYFDLTSGGAADAHEFKLNPGDTIFIEKSTFAEDRSYYTGLIGVIATILSTVLLYREVKK